MKVDIHAGSDVLTSRDSGLVLRKEIEVALDSSSEDIVLNFGMLSLATQGAIDEIVGVLIRKRGAEILRRITFHNARRGIESIIQFVVDESLASQRFNPC